MSESNDNLAKLLHADAAKVEFLSALGEDGRKRLVADVEQAHKSHSRHLRQSMQDALNHIPWLLRGPIRKLFGV